jgi:hypothetical protein
MSSGRGISFGLDSGSSDDDDEPSGRVSGADTGFTTTLVERELSAAATAIRREELDECVWLEHHQPPDCDLVPDPTNLDDLIALDESPAWQEHVRLIEENDEIDVAAVGLRAIGRVRDVLRLLLVGASAYETAAEGQPAAVVEQASQKAARLRRAALCVAELEWPSSNRVQPVQPAPEIGVVARSSLPGRRPSGARRSRRRTTRAGPCRSDDDPHPEPDVAAGQVGLRVSPWSASG